MTRAQNKILKERMNKKQNEKMIKNSDLREITVAESLKQRDEVLKSVPKNNIDGYHEPTSEANIKDGDGWIMAPSMNHVFNHFDAAPQQICFSKELVRKMVSKKNLSVSHGNKTSFNDEEEGRFAAILGSYLMFLHSAKEHNANISDMSSNGSIYFDLDLTDVGFDILDCPTEDPAEMDKLMNRYIISAQVFKNTIFFTIPQNIVPTERNDVFINTDREFGLTMLLHSTLVGKDVSVVA